VVPHHIMLSSVACNSRQLDLQCSMTDIPPHQSAHCTRPSSHSL